MCTAISYLSQNHYFGRNLDLDHHWQEQVAVTPRRFPLAGREEHWGLIGMATMFDGYPLYYEAVNEAGLGVAALNFPGNAVYHKPRAGKENIPSYDLISYVLTRCNSCREAEQLLKNAVITDTPFSKELPVTPLHWFIADREEALVAESTADGLRLYPNPIRVLTNNPPFFYHRAHLADYMALHTGEPDNRFAPGLGLSAYSLGMGALGLPGDFSSSSRFVRAAFLLHNTPCSGTLSHFFQILGSVAVPNGCVTTNKGYQKTLYSCACDTRAGIYYYTTEGNRQITAIDMHRCDLTGDALTLFPLVTKEQIREEKYPLV